MVLCIVGIFTIEIALPSVRIRIRMNVCSVFEVFKTAFFVICQERLPFI